MMLSKFLSDKSVLIGLTPDPWLCQTNAHSKK